MAIFRRKLTQSMAIILAVGLLAGCGSMNTTPLAASETQSGLISPTPTLTSTPQPPKILNICMAAEPTSLYRYSGEDSRAQTSVFAALYDGPFEWDTAQGAYAPSILTDYPSQENGLVQIKAVSVRPGEEVVDATGEVVVFKPGVLVRPAGCQESACAVSWESGDFEMDQMSVTYTLLPDLKWSDGQPLQAQDLELSFQLAQQSALPKQTWALERTASFSAQDDQTVTWQGLPGLTSGNLPAFFWMPMPAHLLAGLDPQQAAAAPAAAQTPPGWGAYRLVSWEPNKALHLEKNPFYFGAASGLPSYDQLNFLIIPDKNQAISMLSAEECDLLDASYALEDLDKPALETLAQSADLHIQAMESTEQLVFGIKPASYDDGYSGWAGDRPDYFSDLRVRQAIAACLQPVELAQQVLAAKFPAELLPQEADWTAGWDAGDLLAQAGWMDADQDPATPRVAQGVAGVEDLTPLSLNLFTTEAELDQQLAQLIVARLGNCGVGVNWQALPAAELYAPGPDGVLFGRKFDLALLSWETTGQNPCRLYLSRAIPNVENAWIGTNLAGLTDPAYDLACGDQQLKIEPPEAQDPWEVIKEYLPAIPLMPHVTVWASRTDLHLDEGMPWSQLESFGVKAP